MLAGALAGALAWLLAACGVLPRRASTALPGTTPGRPSPGTGASSTPGPGPGRLPSPGASGPTTPSPTSSATPTLRARIAGLLVVGFRGARLADAPWIARELGGRGLGGVILFDRDQMSGGARNVSSPAQVARLCSELRQAAGRDIVIAVDQEGGLVTRLSARYGFPTLASEAEIGHATPAEVRRWARTIAGTLTDAGINLNLAPVVDLNLNPDNPAIGALGRSFSADSDVVVAMASIECRAHRANRVRTTLKHFPGIGSASGNTDNGTVDVSATWTAAELEPFRRLISGGLADVVMAAHVIDHKLSPNRPTSLSHAVVTGLLREQLAWSGPIITDDLQARAITVDYGAEEAAILALGAGNDLLLFANQETYDDGVVDRIVEAVAAAVGDGRLEEARIDEAWRRVQGLFDWTAG